MQRIPEHPLRHIITDYLLVIIGAVLIALAADLFAIPNKVIPGGLLGIATIIHYLAGLPVGLLTLAFNVPLLLAGIKWGGGVHFAARTALGFTVMSLAIDVLAPFAPVITHDPLLYIVYGGILDGVGMGLVFRGRGTTGGTDILAKLLQRWAGLSVGTLLLIFNIISLGAAGLIFGWERALYALMMAYVSSRMIDLTQMGFSLERAALIISGKPMEIKRAILKEMGRGVTVLQGQGGYTDTDRPVLLCVIRQPEVSYLKQLIQEIDAAAFVIIGTAQEVLGEGFKKLETAE